MKVEDLKWYSPFLFLLGAILSFADPITDILTLVEFYRTDNKIWFGVGLAFVSLPCLLFPVLYCVVRKDWKMKRGVSCCLKGILHGGFHPFSAAVARIEGFILCVKKWRPFPCVKKWRREDEIGSNSDEKDNVVLDHIRYAAILELFCESLPQFVIQVYVIKCQEERVTIIQMISLPVSFLSLVWTATNDLGCDIMTLERISDPSVKHRLVLFFLSLLYLSSRLVAIACFTVAYKWWVMGVLLFLVIEKVIFFCKDAHKLESLLWKMTSYVMFLLTNLFMILMYYFSDQAKNWYSLPVTVCVCVISVVFVVMDVALPKGVRLRANAVGPQAQNS